MKSSILALTLLALVACGTKSEDPIPDSGSATVDAGGGPVDAGETTPPDAGANPVDAGTETLDAGATTPDAGTTTTDAGTPTSASCSDDSGCTGPGEHCDIFAMRCITGCLIDYDCTYGNVCVGHKCAAPVTCTSDRQCSPGVCGAGGRCVDCKTTADCGTNAYCLAGSCVGAPKACSAARDCAERNQVCAGRICTECGTDADCLDPARTKCRAGVCRYKYQRCDDSICSGMAPAPDVHMECLIEDANPFYGAGMTFPRWRFCASKPSPSTGCPSGLTPPPGRSELCSRLCLGGDAECQAWGMDGCDFTLVCGAELR